MKKCFECGESATEEHHVIPKVMGGTKTVSLCTKCHMKVHGLDGTRRADNHRENIKRGIDKNRVWELYAVYSIVTQDEISDISILKNSLKTEFNLDFTLDKTERLYNRFQENDQFYLKTLFDQFIDSELSDTWDDGDAAYKMDLFVDEIAYLFKNQNELNKDNIEEKAREMSLKINQRFLEKKMKKKSSNY